MINARARKAPQRIPSISYPVGWCGLLVAVNDGNEGWMHMFCSETAIIPRQEQRHCSQNR